MVSIARHESHREKTWFVAFALARISVIGNNK